MFLWVFKNNFLASTLESIYVGDVVEIQHGLAKVIEINYEKKLGCAKLQKLYYPLKFSKKNGWYSDEQLTKKEFFKDNNPKKTSCCTKKNGTSCKKCQSSKVIK